MKLRSSIFPFYCFFILVQLWTIALNAADTTFSSDTTLTEGLRLSSSGRAIVTANATIAGAGYFWQCPITADQVIVVNAGVAATLQNLLLRDFANAHLSLGSGSSITFGNNTVVQTLADQSLTKTLSFSGNSTLTGYNNTIDLAGGGSIIVQPGGCLTIANVSLINVASSNLYCVDNTGSIKFENVTISIPATWTWSHGSFSVAKNVELFDGIFVYASGMTSTVSANSRLILSNNLTFSYDPAIPSGQSSASQLGLVFTNTTSWLVLNGCNLYVTNTGMQLLKGSLEVIGQNNLYSDALASASQGLLLGDGVTFANDFMAKKFNANLAGITVKKGLLTYQNVEISPGPPICYGDAIILKHSTYGFYLQPTVPAAYGDNIGSWVLYGSSSKPTSNYLGYFFVEDLSGGNRFGAANVVGTTIKSGNNIRLESVNLQGWSLLFNPGTSYDVAKVSTPCPPYHVPVIIDPHYFFSPNTQDWLCNACKIYKQGARVGDPIYKDDPIYIVSWSTFGGSLTSMWLGSANLAYLDGFEAIYYQYTVANSAPPNFPANFLWTISDVLPALYLNSQVVQNSSIDPISHQAINLSSSGYSPNLSAFPSNASTYQF